MPYDVTGYDSAGVLHTYEMTDDGTVSAQDGDDLLTGWLGSNAFEKPEPIEGETPPESGELTPSQLEAMRQHLSKLLTNVQLAKQPEDEEQSPTPQAPSTTSTSSGTSAPSASTTSAPRSTQTELEAMTVTDLRNRATTAQIVGASSMTKAELVTALLAYQGT